MRFDVLTLFPEMFQGYLGQSILKLALERGLVEINLWNIRDWAKGKHKSVDDRPFGGGPGMVIMPEPVFAAVEAIRPQDADPGLLVLLTPAGERLRPPQRRAARSPACNGTRSSPYRLKSRVAAAYSSICSMLSPFSL